MKPPPRAEENWLKGPASSALGKIWLAGELHGRSTIPVEKMRVLGRHALILVLDGAGYYADGAGQRRELAPGDAILVTPELPHAYGGKDGSAWGQAYAVFTGPCFDQLHQSQLFRSRLPVWHLEPVELWRRRMQDILLRPGTAGPVEALRTVGRFTQLLIEMATTDAAAHQRPEDAWLEESLHLLGEARKDGWLDPHKVAAQVGLSYETFRKRFSARMGQAPGQFQQQRKIDHACAAIYRGSDNFKQLAEELGFCDIYHFSKVFRRVAGSPPAAYRRIVRGG